MTTRIPKTALNREAYNEPALFYRSAREGMHDFLANTLESPTAGVLLPAYIGWSPREGSGVYDPVRALSARSGFYNLNDDLTVDISDLAAQLENAHYRVLVVIHYFGRTEPQLAAIRELADRHDVLLVEDLAHGFFSAHSNGDAGRFGDVKLFSLHKMFPLAGGGLVCYANASLLNGQQQTAPELASELLSFDWRAIAEARRKNFFNISTRLSELPECGSAFHLLWPHLGPIDVPQTLPVRIVDGDRDAIYEGMNADGFGMVSLYHTLIEEVRTSFDNLMELSRQIINFPVHQDVQSDSVSALVASFQHSLNQR